jgi:chromate reductase, NAD(P)H dehydrogenase (quinone)
MLPFPEIFESRPVAFMGVAAGPYSALRPVEQLQQIFGYRNAYLYPNRVFISGVHTVLNEAGELTDEKLKKRLAAQAKGFAKFAAKVSE